MLESKLREYRKLFGQGQKSMADDELLFYYSLINMTGVQTVIECGTYLGVSTAWAAMALIDSGATGKVVTVDIQDRTGKLVYEGTKLESRIITVVGDFSAKVAGVVKRCSKSRPFLVLIDGGHGYEEHKRAWDAVAPHLTQDDWVIFHDTETTKGSRRLVNEMQERMVLVPGTYGFGFGRCLGPCTCPRH
jgi:predicted O-methyltransferase YrrM